MQHTVGTRLVSWASSCFQAKHIAPHRVRRIQRFLLPLQLPAVGSVGSHVDLLPTLLTSIKGIATSRKGITPLVGILLLPHLRASPFMCFTWHITLCWALAPRVWIFLLEPSCTQQQRGRPSMWRADDEGP